VNRAQALSAPLISAFLIKIKLKSIVI